MSKKYVIEIKPEYEDTTKGVMVLGARESNLYVDTISIENLEELNSDYINEHFGDLQDEAYKKGLHDGESKCGYCNEYQRGLDDAWECAKKMTWTAKHGGYGERLSDVFGRTDSFDFFDYTPNEAIEKLKAFEQKQGEINVGDVVEWDGTTFLVTKIYQPFKQKEQCDGIDEDGCVYDAILTEGLTKTGRHFDIESILEDMRE